ncbi:MAG TPA: MBL fold metallo-hydrolase [Dehalococcoidales bacterium]|nr:MBL fold metallo-hydrolase [Dehalococcoidales bacterium]
MALKFRVFLHSYLGFNSNSTLFYGERDAILIDASQLLSDTHRMIAEIIPMRKNLTHIYVSHFHPDHHFGLQVLQQAFPKAKIAALPSVVKDIIATSSDKIELWAIDRFGPDDIPRRTTIPEPMPQPYLTLEGQEILVSDDWEGDSINNSVVWVPSIRVACATDVAFHDCHLWPIESNVARRIKWRASIAKMRELEARIVIPGHCDAAKIRLMEDVQEKGTLSYTQCIDWSIQYLNNYEEVYNTARNAVQMVDAMNRLYPAVKAEDFAIHWQARLLFPRSSPDWLTPLPGQPGKIFLNPNGGYDGDPPRE